MFSTTVLFNILIFVQHCSLFSFHVLSTPICRDETVRRRFISRTIYFHISFWDLLFLILFFFWLLYTPSNFLWTVHCTTTNDYLSNASWTLLQWNLVPVIINIYTFGISNGVPVDCLYILFGNWIVRSGVGSWANHWQDIYLGNWGDGLSWNDLVGHQARLTGQ